jgi:hypothetical protein
MCTPAAVRVEDFLNGDRKVDKLEWGVLDITLMCLLAAKADGL